MPSATVPAPTPQTTASQTRRFGSYHPGICQFVFGDGSVHALNNNIALTTFQALATRAEGLHGLAFSVDGRMLVTAACTQGGNGPSSLLVWRAEPGGPTPMLAAD